MLLRPEDYDFSYSFNSEDLAVVRHLQGLERVAGIKGFCFVDAYANNAGESIDGITESFYRGKPACLIWGERYFISPNTVREFECVLGSLRNGETQDVFVLHHQKHEGRLGELNISRVVPIEIKLDLGNITMIGNQFMRFVSKL